MDNKPVVQGPVDGNIFAIVGAAWSAMERDRIDRAAMRRMSSRVMDSDSYHEAINVIMEYVDFVGVE